MSVGQRRRFTPRGPVRSEPLPSREVTKTTTPKPRFHWDRLVPVLFGFFILGLWWAAGGKWTIEGMPLLLNEIFNFFRIGVRLPSVTNPWWYLGLIWLPIGISIVEHKYAPWRAWGTYAIMAMPFILLIWLVVTAADWGSTYQAITHPAADAWLIAQQVATYPALSIPWVTLTTFIPELGFAVLTWWLWEPDPIKKS